VRPELERKPAGRIDPELLLRETNHRCHNDLQLVVGLLRLQGRSAKSEDARRTLEDVADRVAVLARSRAALSAQAALSLEAALESVCRALRVHADPRGIVIALDLTEPADWLPSANVTHLALIVNELATNALKHAFNGAPGGRIDIIVGKSDARDVVISVDDDGEPMRDPGPMPATGTGLMLVRRLIASMGGSLVPPRGAAKRFELRVPIADGASANI
jgi:two-component sensor histidine kinase